MLIYKIENKTNGMVYIGQTTKTVAERVYQHIQKKSKIGKAIVKEGKENFTVTVLDHATNRQELDELERYWIAFFNARENGYNTLSGGKPTKKELSIISLFQNRKCKKRRKKKEIEKREKEKAAKKEKMKEPVLKEYIDSFGDSKEIRKIFGGNITWSQLRFFAGEAKAFKKCFKG